MSKLRTAEDLPIAGKLILQFDGGLQTPKLDELARMKAEIAELKSQQFYLAPAAAAAAPAPALPANSKRSL